MLSAGASLNAPPELQQLALNFLATVFLLVTLQNNNRHTSARAHKIFHIRNIRPLSIREAPTGRYGGLSTGSVNAEPVCRLCQLIINEITSHVRPGARKNS